MRTNTRPSIPEFYNRDEIIAVQSPESLSSIVKRMTDGYMPLNVRKDVYYDSDVMPDANQAPREFDDLSDIDYQRMEDSNVEATQVDSVDSSPSVEPSEVQDAPPVQVAPSEVKSA